MFHSPEQSKFIWKFQLQGQNTSATSNEALPTSNGVVPTSNGFINPQFSSLESQKSLEKSQNVNEKKSDVSLRKVPEPPKSDETVKKGPENESVVLDQGMGSFEL